MLYRIDWEHDEYQGNDEWKTINYYQYVFGLRNLGKTSFDCDPNTRILQVVKLSFSLKALRVCLKNTISSTYNQTV